MEGRTVPSTSKAQHKLMEIAAHTSGGYGGVPQKVGKDFARADDKAGITKQHRTNGSSPRSAEEHMAKRKAQGLSHRAVAGEFGTSKSTAHRKVTKALGQGFTREGSAR